MATFVDCSKYTKEQDVQDKAIENLAAKNDEQDKSIDVLKNREIVHDTTLTGGGISTDSPLSVAVSTKDGNAVKTGDAAGGTGVFVKDLGPQVEALEKALKDERDRLSGDLTTSIRDLNNRLNNLKNIEVALNQAKTDGNYQRIKDLEAQLSAAKQAEDLANKNLADAIESLRQQGLTDDQIRQIIADSLAKAGGSGKYVTGITVNQATGDVTYTYSDGTKLTGKLHSFQGVVVDDQTIGGNGADKALHVKLSKVPGNLIRQNDDGLYIGQTSKRPVLYVDAINGSDDNVGTREKPLKTFRYAILTGESGDSQTIYLHEGQDHIINAEDGIAYVSGRFLHIRPYGEFGDASLKKNGGNTFLVSLDYARNPDKAPRLVFKGVRKQWYRPSDGEYTRAITNCIRINNNGSMTIHGVTMVNDIGFSFTVEASDVFDNKGLGFATNTTRIEVLNANMDIINARFATTGSPSIYGELYDGVDDNYKAAQLRRKTSAGLYQLCFVYGNNCTVNMRNLYGLDSLESYMFHTPGWDPRINNSFIMSCDGGIDLDLLTKLTFGPTIETQPSGDKIVLAPASNIPNSIWAKQHG